LSADRPNRHLTVKEATVVVGADVHKRTHTFVAVDDVGRKLGEKVVSATTAGHQDAVCWARERFGVEVVWAIEDCRHLSARLERDLMAGGQKVVRVPPKMMAQTRASARTPGKSDPIDALAMARESLREPDADRLARRGVARTKLLVDRRGVATAVTTAHLWRVHELDPARGRKARSLGLAKHGRLLGDWLVNQPGLVAELARDELADIARLTEAIDALAKRIAERVRTVAPTLLAMPGCGELTAAKLVGEAAGVTRFSEAASRATGVAPIPCGQATPLAGSG
jgi:transposase